MRIVIDLQGAQGASNSRGVGGYTLALAQAMVRLRDKHHIVIALNGSLDDSIEPIRAAFDGLTSQDNIRVWGMPSPATASQKGDEWRRRAGEILREAFLATLRPDIVHITDIFAGFDNNIVHTIGVFEPALRFAVTLHDTVAYSRKHTNSALSPAHEKFYRRQHAYLKQADIFLRASESAGGDFIVGKDIDASRCVTISGAASPNFMPGAVPQAVMKRTREKFKISRAVVLCVGAADGRNNYLRVIKAFALLPGALQKSHQLVVVGALTPANRRELE